MNGGMVGSGYHRLVRYEWTGSMAEDCLGRGWALRIQWYDGAERPRATGRDFVGMFAFGGGGRVLIVVVCFLWTDISTDRSSTIELAEVFTTRTTCIGSGYLKNCW